MDKGEIKEIRKEFQLDRMILFSDAVFAIVITIMAIEIRLPDHSSDTLPKQISHLVPVIFAYTASFIFIGQIWYQHLQVFGLLKNYDKGLVVRNLAMLFWMGFFPFSVTLIASNSNKFLSFVVYFLVIFLCKGAQLMLQHYILIKRPQLRVNDGIHDELIRYKKSRAAVVLLAVVFVLAISTVLLVKDEGLKYLAWWWFLPFPFVLKHFQKKIK